MFNLRFALSISILCIGLLIGSPLLTAATLIWDNNASTEPNPQDGSGTWNTSNLNWWNADTSSNVAWNNTEGHTAQFNWTGPATSNILLSGPLFQVGGLTFTAASPPATSTFSHTFSTATVLEILNGGTIDTQINSRINLTASVSFKATNGFTKTGSGLFTISSTTGLIGETLIQAGVVDIFGTSHFSKLTLTGSSSLVTHSSNTMTFDELVYDSSSTLSLAAYNGNSNYTIGAGGLTLKRSTINLHADGAVNSTLFMKGNITMDTVGGTAAISTTGPGTATQKRIDFDDGIRDITVASNGQLTINAIITNGGFTKKDTGTLVLGGANTLTKALLIEDGVVQMSGASAQLANGTADLHISALGTFDLGGTNQTLAALSGSGTIRNTRGSAGANSLTLHNDTVENTFTGLISNRVSGSGTTTFIKSGAAKLNLSGNNTHSGGTTLRGGLTEITDATLYTANVTVNRTFGTGVLNLEGGNLSIYINGNNEASTSNSSQILSYSNQASLTENTTITFNRLTGSPATWKTLNFGSLTVNAAGKTLTATGSNNYTLRFSSLTLNHDTTLDITSSTGHLTINGTINAAGKNLVKNGIGKLTFTGGNIGSYTATAGQLDTFGTSIIDVANFNGSSSFLTHSGNSTTFNTLNYHTSSSSNFYAAGTTALYTIGELNMSSGTLRWQNESNSAPTITSRVLFKGNINITGNATFEEIATGTGQRIIDLETRENNFNVSGSAILTNGVQLTNGAVQKSGTGTMILSNSRSDYIGGTRVTGGTLQASNTSGSATGTGSVIVTTATLSGNGFLAPIAGNKVTIGANGILAPGTIANAIGTLTVQGDSEFLAGTGLADRSVLSLQIRNKTSGQYDVFHTSGALDFGGIVRVTFAESFNASQLLEGDSFDFLNWGTASFTNFNSPENFDLPNLSAYNLAWNTSSFTTNGILSIMQIPEPSRALLLSIAATAILMRRRISRLS